MPAAGSLPVDSAEDAEALHLKLVRFPPPLRLARGRCGPKSSGLGIRILFSPGFGADWLLGAAFP